MKKQSSSNKNYLKSIIGKSMVLGVVLALIAAVFSPMLRIYATQHGTGDYELGISVDSNADWVASMQVGSDDWNANDTYLSNDGRYFIALELHIPNDEEKEEIGVRSGGGIAGEYAVQQAGESEDWNGTHRKYTFTITYDTTVQHDHLSLNPYSEDHNDNNNGGEGNMLATVKICGENHRDASFGINNTNSDRGWYLPSNEDAVDGGNCSQVVRRYNGADDDEYIDLGLATLWHQKFDGPITINNTPYNLPFDYSDEAAWFEHYANQMVTIRLNVPKANDDTYTINLGVVNNEDKFIGNFLWTADPEQEFEVAREDGRILRDENGNYIYLLDENGNKIPNFNYIGHSKIELVAVSYTLGDMTYSCNVDTDNCSAVSSREDVGGMGCKMSEDDECAGSILRYVEYGTDPTVEYDDGSLVVPAGARVTMRIIPDYGYQVLNVNMAELTVSDDGVGEFTFTVPAGAAYFNADVVKMSDEVSTTSDLVIDGSIDLGDNQTTLDHGTARLYVHDIDLSDKEIAGFEDAAGDFKIKTFLDISLYNITYKGNTDEAWEDRIRDLNEEATITLQLDEGIDGNEIVIVHQKHDGTYEVIPTVYDSVAQTLTFKTSSFSNYAIASRTVNSPETGASMSTESGASTASNYSVIVALVVVAVMAILCYNCRHDSEQR